MVAERHGRTKRYLGFIFVTRLMTIALKNAPKGEHKQFRMCALVIRGGAILSVGVNQKWNHAETRALRPHMDYVGAKMYVARENGGISKPCASCMAKIKEAGISEVHYMDRDGAQVRERVR